MVVFINGYVMEIECQGCYYTLCAFVCLTEDLSEILQFLWKHGCLRRSYSCEKCGRKCAIGDKDLFFRCNRNALDIPLNSQDLASHDTSSSAHGTDCGPPTRLQPPRPQQQHAQANGDNQIPHHRYAVHEADGHQSTGMGHVHGPNSDDLMLVHDGNRLHRELVAGEGMCRSDSVHLADVVLDHGDPNRGERLLTVMDSRGSRVIRSADRDNVLLSSENHAVHNATVLQSETMMAASNPGGFAKQEATSEASPEEPPHKSVRRRSPCKAEGSKAPKKRCNFKVSMKKGTFFEKSKLPIDTVCKFVVFWCCMKHPTQEFLRNELSLATRTVVDWSTACREICIHWAKSVSEKIGGDGVMVQIDEVKIQESKESKQSDSGNRFSFWGMEKDKEKGKIFIVPVPACDSWSLLTVVNDWILPGSVIISNCWKAYDCLKLQEFVQQTAVQSKIFVHPQNNSGQQGFDGKVDEAGASAGSDYQMPRFGTRRSHHLGDLAEFMFKRRYSNHLERMHVFFKQISLAYPLH